MNESFPEKAVNKPEGERLRWIGLRDFRNYAELELEFQDGLVIFHGPNAQGKTNLLEACYLLATTRLLRGSRDADAVRHGQSRARVEVVLDPSQTTLTVDLEAGKRKLAKLNHLKLPRAADLIGRLPCVCISAFDMAIVRGGPEDRRFFLDMELSQLSKAYLNHFAHYRRSLEHRNALLRRAGEFEVSNAEFEPWEESLAEHGAAMRWMREALVDRLRPLASAYHAEMSGGETLTVLYEPKDDAVSAESLLALLGSTRARDIARGATSIGPHRDDLAMTIGSEDVRHFGSQGQQRTAVLALKLATHQYRVEETRSTPLLLLDDVFSDLDEGRRARLVDWLLRSAGQAILTCTEPEAAGGTLLSRATLYRVQAGNVRLG